MKRIVCEMCGGTEFIKENNLFVCQDCGCKYTPEEARKLMVEIPEEKTKRHPVTEPEENDDDPRAGFKHHTAASPNRICVSVDRVGHETYTMRSVMSLTAFLGEPEPEFVEGPDEVGHIGAAITVHNLAGKTIKYITVYLTPYNAVGDAVSCTVLEHSTFGIEVTGPLCVGEHWQGYSDGMWYNHSIVAAKIAFATVEYTDGTKEWFDESSLTKKESNNERLATAQICYNCNAGAPQELWYTLDHGEKMTLTKGETRTHYLQPGQHTISIKNPFVKKEYTFTAKGDKKIEVFGKSFGMDIQE